MKENGNNKQDTSPINILDLDKLDNNTNIDYDEMSKSEEYLVSEEEASDNSSIKRKTKKLPKISIHLLFLVVLILCMLFIVHRIKNWGTIVNWDDLITEDDGNEEDTVEVLDNILPNLYEGDEPALTDGVTQIVLFGNGAFAEDYGTDDNVGNIIAELADATVYNCSVSGSYLAASKESFYVDQDPMDAFNFYWLATFAALDNDIPCRTALEEASDPLPEEARDVYKLLLTLDFTTIDVIGIMYDASDYLDGRPVYNAANETDIQTFSGNLAAGVELLQAAYPHIRIIIMSPTYAYAINKAGEYVDSDQYVYNEYDLSTYALMLERSTSPYGVSFVDNIYGTVNVYNAKDYLIDNVRLNKDGKQKLAERFVYALTYYD